SIIASDSVDTSATVSARPDSDCPMRAKSHSSHVLPMAVVVKLTAPRETPDNNACDGSARLAHHAQPNQVIADSIAPHATLTNGDRVRRFMHHTDASDWHDVPPTTT